MNGEKIKYTYCESLCKNQCLDKNGNNEASDDLNNNFYTGSTREKENDDVGKVKPKNQIDQKAISRFQAMAMSDDDDYGET